MASPARPRRAPTRPPGSLTRNQWAVYDALRRAGRPQTAYEILDAVRASGISAPPTVYRALRRLTRDGLAHRLESLNSFIACAGEESHQGATVFLVCDTCGTADESSDSTVARRLRACAGEREFSIRSPVVELRGLCRSCAVAA